MTKRRRSIGGRIGAIGLALTIAWVPLGFIYALYAWITYTGLYRWLAEWHMEGTNRYDSNGTFLDLVMLVGGPPILLLLLLVKLGVLGETPGAAAAAAPGPKPAAPPSPEGSSAWVIRALGWGLVVLTAVSIGSAWIWYEQSQTPTAYEPVDISDGRAPISANVELTGKVQSDMFVRFKDGDEHYTYVPLTPDGWHAGQPIVYFVALHYSADPDSLPATMTQKGLLGRNDLPGAVAAAFEKHGYVLASPTLVLDVGASTADKYIYIAIASGSLPVVAVFFVLFGGVSRLASRIKGGLRRPMQG